jgi:DNA-binding CsgD family transcriptional regulator/tetratricopeptide (TPR) repeat protein
MIRGMPARISSGRLVGRDAQVAELVAATQRVVTESKPRVVLVGGEAGVGKTRLIEEMADRPELSAARFSLGHCVEISQGDLPFAPVVEALRQSLQDLPPDKQDAVLGGARDELTGLFPELGPDASRERTTGIVNFGQGRFFELLLGVLDRLGGAPAILVVEDLHWADASTRDFLGFIARSTRTARLLVVATYRTDELHRRHPLRPFLGEIERLPTVESFEVPRLSRQQVADQIHEILGALPPIELADRVFQLSEGNPFFVEELLAAAERDEGGLPRSIRDALLFRLEGVGEGTQKVLRVASVAGREVPHRLLEEVTEVEPHVLDESLREAVGRHLLVADQKRETYAFRHALLREAVYEDLLPGERTRLHRVFARVLESAPELAQSSANAAAELAYHFYEARDFPKALQASVAAGQAAWRSYAFAEARRHFERALDLWDNVSDAEGLAGLSRVELIGAAADSANGQGDPERASAHSRDALARLDPEVDPVATALTYERLGRFLWVLGKTGDAHEAHETAVELMKSEPPSAEHARVLAGQAQILMLSARFTESVAVAEQAIDMARKVDAKQVLGHAMNSLGVDKAYMDDPEKGIEYLREALGIAEAIDNYDDIGRAYTNLCELLMIAGKFEEGLAEYENALEVDDRIGLSRGYGVWHRADLANALVPLGRWDEAERLLDEIDFLPYDQVAGNIAFARARLATHRGHFEKAAGDLEAARGHLAFVLQPQSLGPLRIAEAELALWRKRPYEGREAVRTGLSELRMTEEKALAVALSWLGVRVEADISEIARAQKDDRELAASRDIAGDLLSEAKSVDLPESFFGPPTGPFALGCLATLDGEMSRLVGEPSSGAWEEAAEVWAGLGDPFQAAYCRWREGEASLLLGDRTNAAEALTSAHRTAAELRAIPLLEELRALAQRGRVSLEEPEETGGTSKKNASGGDGAGLTARELEVLKLVAEGLTNSQIAESLFISRKTVSVHVSHILEKFGVTSRVEAAGVAYRLGLTDTDRVERDPA